MKELSLLHRHLGILWKKNFVVPKKFEHEELLPDTVPSSSFQPCVKCFRAGKESELEMKSCSKELHKEQYFWHNMSKLKLLN